MVDEKTLYFFNEKSNDPGSMQQNQATFIDILLVYATVDEITFYNESTSNNNLRAFYGTTSEDLEFKKLIWSGVLTAI